MRLVIIENEQIKVLLGNKWSKPCVKVSGIQHKETIQRQLIPI